MDHITDDKDSVSSSNREKSTSSSSSHDDIPMLDIHIYAPIQSSLQSEEPCESLGHPVSPTNNSLQHSSTIRSVNDEETVSTECSQGRAPVTLPFSISFIPGSIFRRYQIRTPIPSHTLAGLGRGMFTRDNNPPQNITSPSADPISLHQHLPPLFRSFPLSQSQDMLLSSFFESEKEENLIDPFFLSFGGTGSSKISNSPSYSLSLFKVITMEEARSFLSRTPPPEIRKRRDLLSISYKARSKVRKPVPYRRQGQCSSFFSGMDVIKNEWEKLDCLSFSDSPSESSSHLNPIQLSLLSSKHSSTTHKQHKSLLYQLSSNSGGSSGINSTSDRKSTSNHFSNSNTGMMRRPSVSIQNDDLFAPSKSKSFQGSSISQLSNPNQRTRLVSFPGVHTPLSLPLLLPDMQPLKAQYHALTLSRTSCSSDMDAIPLFDTWMTKGTARDGQGRGSNSSALAGSSKMLHHHLQSLNGSILSTLHSTTAASTSTDQGSAGGSNNNNNNNNTSSGSGGGASITASSIPSANGIIGSSGTGMMGSSNGISSLSERKSGSSRITTASALTQDGKISVVQKEEHLASLILFTHRALKTFLPPPLLALLIREIEKETAEGVRKREEEARRRYFERQQRWKRAEKKKIDKEKVRRDKISQKIQKLRKNRERKQEKNMFKASSHKSQTANNNTIKVDLVDFDAMKGTSEKITKEGEEAKEIESLSTVGTSMTTNTTNAYEPPLMGGSSTVSGLRPSISMEEIRIQKQFDEELGQFRETMVQSLQKFKVQEQNRINEENMMQLNKCGKVKRVQRPKTPRGVPHCSIFRNSSSQDEYSEKITTSTTTQDSHLPPMFISSGVPIPKKHIYSSSNRASSNDNYPSPLSLSIPQTEQYFQKDSDTGTPSGDRIIVKSRSKVQSLSRTNIKTCSLPVSPPPLHTSLIPGASDVPTGSQGTGQQGGKNPLLAPALFTKLSALKYNQEHGDNDIFEGLPSGQNTASVGDLPSHSQSCPHSPLFSRSPHQVHSPSHVGYGIHSHTATRSFGIEMKGRALGGPLLLKEEDGPNKARGGEGTMMPMSARHDTQHEPVKFMKGGERRSILKKSGMRNGLNLDFEKKLRSNSSRSSHSLHHQPLIPEQQVDPSVPTHIVKATSLTSSAVSSSSSRVLPVGGIGVMSSRKEFLNNISTSQISSLTCSTSSSEDNPSHHAHSIRNGRNLSDIPLGESIKEYSSESDHMPFICEHCGKAIPSKRPINTHKHSTDYITSPQSSKHHQKALSASSHEAPYPDHMPFICEHCGKAIPSKRPINTHKHSTDYITSPQSSKHHQKALSASSHEAPYPYCQHPYSSDPSDIRLDGSSMSSIDAVEGDMWCPCRHPVYPSFLERPISPIIHMTLFPQRNILCNSEEEAITFPSARKKAPSTIRSQGHSSHSQGHSSDESSQQQLSAGKIGQSFLPYSVISDTASNNNSSGWYQSALPLTDKDRETLEQRERDIQCGVYGCVGYGGKYSIRNSFLPHVFTESISELQNRLLREEEEENERIRQKEEDAEKLKGGKKKHFSLLSLGKRGSNNSLSKHREQKKRMAATEAEDDEEGMFDKDRSVLVHLSSSFARAIPQGPSALPPTLPLSSQCASMSEISPEKSDMDDVTVSHEGVGDLSGSINQHSGSVSTSRLDGKELSSSRTSRAVILSDPPSDDPQGQAVSNRADSPSGSGTGHTTRNIISNVVGILSGVSGEEEHGNSPECANNVELSREDVRLSMHSPGSSPSVCSSSPASSSSTSPISPISDDVSSSYSFTASQLSTISQHLEHVVSKEARRTRNSTRITMNGKGVKDVSGSDVNGGKVKDKASTVVHDGDLELSDDEAIGNTGDNNVSKTMPKAMVRSSSKETGIKRAYNSLSILKPTRMHALTHHLRNSSSLSLFIFTGSDLSLSALYDSFTSVNVILIEAQAMLNGVRSGGLLDEAVGICVRESVCLWMWKRGLGKVNLGRVRMRVSSQDIETRKLIVGNQSEQRRSVQNSSQHVSMDDDPSSSESIHITAPSNPSNNSEIVDPFAIDAPVKELSLSDEGSSYVEHDIATDVHNGGNINNGMDCGMSISDNRAGKHDGKSVVIHPSPYLISIDSARSKKDSNIIIGQQQGQKPLLIKHPLKPLVGEHFTQLFLPSFVFYPSSDTLFTAKTMLHQLKSHSVRSAKMGVLRITRFRSLFRTKSMQRKLISVKTELRKLRNDCVSWMWRGDSVSFVQAIDELMNACREEWRR
ncbi:hypothetical protein ADUPG1_013290, partial [Aduncisulcus paluster]